MEIKKKKCVLLVDRVSDWLQIWTAASSLDVRGNKAIKNKFVFLTNRFVFPNMVTYLKNRIPFLFSLILLAIFLRAHVYSVL